MDEIDIHTANGIFQTKSFRFAGGEVQVQIPEFHKIKGDISVVARLQSSDSIIQLCLTNEAINRLQKPTRRTLVVPYFPYARQDRVMQSQEAFSLKPITKIINSLNFDRVVICDPHSEVTAALVDRIDVFSQLDLMKSNEGIGRIIHSCITIIAPDAGATKKAFSVAQHYGLPLLTASKLRDVKTGDITRTELHNADSIAGRNALIVDDICDGGRTFIELAKVLRDAGAAKIYLYVTHGIFSQGLGVFDGFIDGIFTTNSFNSPFVGEDHPIPLYISKINFNANGVAA